MDDYPCTQCGACCRLAYMIPELPTAADGQTCAHLKETTDDAGAARFLCGVYETRPDICHIEKQIPAHVTPRRYHEMAAGACELLQDHFGISAPYRVELPETAS